MSLPLRLLQLSAVVVATPATPLQVDINPCVGNASDVGGAVLSTDELCILVDGNGLIRHIKVGNNEATGATPVTLLELRTTSGAGGSTLAGFSLRKVTQLAGANTNIEAVFTSTEEQSLTVHVCGPFERRLLSHMDVTVRKRT
jgi:hypothetical protein